MTIALEAQLRVTRGDFTLDANVHVQTGEVLALLGPNGSGKSTLLAALAGLIAPESGTVAVFGRQLTRKQGGPIIAVPASRRSIGLLGQDPSLFPHLSALDNVAFGQQAQGIPRRVAVAEARVWLQAVGLDGMSSRKPGQLSGGQQQRVAIARALAARPKILLLDEPLAALDVQTAVAIRQLLRDQLAQSGTPAIVVTHDVLDALVLADRVAILHEGRIIDEGATARVLGAPRNPFIAALAGLNLVEGVSVSDNGKFGHEVNGIRLADGRVLNGRIGYGGQDASHTSSHSRLKARIASQVSAVFSPSSVGVRLAEPGADDQLNRWKAVVSGLEQSAGGIRVRTVDDAGVAAELSAARVAELGLREGMPVWLTVAAADVTIHFDPPRQGSPMAPRTASL